MPNSIIHFFFSLILTISKGFGSGQVCVSVVSKNLFNVLSCSVFINVFCMHEILSN